MKRKRLEERTKRKFWFYAVIAITCIILFAFIGCTVITPEEANKIPYLLERTNIFLLPEAKESNERYEAGIRHLWDAEYAEALSIFEELTGEEETAEKLNGLAITHHYLGNYTAAEENMQKAIELAENEQQKIVLTNNMGVVQAALKKLDDSDQYYREAAEMQLERWREEDSTLIEACIKINQIANVANRGEGGGEKRFVELRNAIEKWPKKDQLLFSFLDAQIISINFNSIGVETAKGDMRKDMSIFMDVLSAEHPQVTFLLDDIAFMTDEWDEAIEQYKIVIDKYEKQLGKKHPYTAKAYYNMGVCYDEKTESGKAKECYEHALDIYNSITTGPTESYLPYSGLGLYYWNQKQPEEALKYLIKAYQSLLKNNPYHKPRLEKAVASIKVVYVYLGMEEDNFDKWLEEQMAREDAESETESEAA